MMMGVREIEEHRAALQRQLFSLFAVQRAMTLTEIEASLSMTYRQLETSRGTLAESYALLRRAGG